jgi:ABC-2 type transport system ATP-binding protein
MWARNIVKRYGQHPVLDGASLEVAPGEIVALLGPNGSGKTTLLSILVGLLQPDSGEVTRREHRIGWVPQGAGTYGRLTVRENLALFARLLKIPGDAATTAEAAIAEAHLAPWSDHRCWQLSGGLRQRLSVAIGLLGSPHAIVLDEPATGVDLAHRKALWSVLRRRAAEGCAVLVSTHDMRDAKIADRVCVLSGGTLTYNGRLDGLAASGSDPLDERIEAGLLALWGTPQ